MQSRSELLTLECGEWHPRSRFATKKERARKRPHHAAYYASSWETTAVLPRLRFSPAGGFLLLQLLQIFSWPACLPFAVRKHNQLCKQIHVLSHATTRWFQTISQIPTPWSDTAIATTTTTKFVPKTRYMVFCRIYLRMVGHIEYRQDGHGNVFQEISIAVLTHFTDHAIVRCRTILL